MIRSFTIKEVRQRLYTARIQRAIADGATKMRHDCRVRLLRRWLKKKLKEEGK